MSPTFLSELSHNALIGVTGDDARAFLHAQFTNDVEALPVGGAQWNGWCTAKGRLLATFLLVRRDNGFLILLPAEIAEAITKRLRMFVLRSKVKLEDVSAQWQRFGLAGPEAAAIVANIWSTAPAPMKVVTNDDGAEAIGLGPECFVILASVSSAPDLRGAMAAPATMADTGAWDRTLIKLGIPIIVAATQEAFVPQMVNYELIGGVSFKKGCYPGQEIVARMHYRGGLKRRMALAHVAGTEAPKPGDALFSAAFGEQAAGEVANVAPAPQGGFDTLVVAQLEGLARRDLRWKSPQGPVLELRELPYEVSTTP